MAFSQGNSSQDWGATLLRVALGIMFITHGQFKLVTLGIAPTMAFFEGVGFPGWTVYPVVTAEVVGGLMLIAGLHARWVAPALTPILFGAISVHLGNGWVFSAKGGGWEYPAFLIAACVIQALLGDGAWALRMSRPSGEAKRHTVRKVT